MGSLSELGFRQTLEEVSTSRKRLTVGNGTHCVLSDEATYLSFGLRQETLFPLDTELETRPASLKWHCGSGNSFPSPHLVSRRKYLAWLWMGMSFPD
jgi:hypothetical protein